MVDIATAKNVAKEANTKMEANLNALPTFVAMALPTELLTSEAVLNFHRKVCSGDLLTWQMGMQGDEIASRFKLPSGLESTLTASEAPSLENWKPLVDTHWWRLLHYVRNETMLKDLEAQSDDEEDSEAQSDDEEESSDEKEHVSKVARK